MNLHYQKIAGMFDYSLKDTLSDHMPVECFYTSNFLLLPYKGHCYGDYSVVLEIVVYCKYSQKLFNLNVFVGYLFLCIQLFACLFLLYIISLLLCQPLIC